MKFDWLDFVLIYGALFVAVFVVPIVFLVSDNQTAIIQAYLLIALLLFVRYNNEIKNVTIFYPEIIEPVLYSRMWLILQAVALLYLPLQLWLAYG